MVSLPSNSFSFLLNKFVIAVHQISEFIKTIHFSIVYFKYVFDKIEYFIHFVIKDYPKSDGFNFDFVVSIERRSIRSTSIEIFRYPFQWATNTPAFRKTVKNFTVVTENLRQIPIVKSFFDNKMQKFT